MSQLENPSFTISGEDCGSGARGTVTIQLHSQTPDVDADYLSSIWLEATITASVGGFKAAFQDTLCTADASHLLEDCKRLYANLEGEAANDFVEGWCKIRIKMIRGSLEWAIQLQYPAGTGTSLSMTLNADQSYLPPLIASLEHLVDRYPFRGFESP